jgi:hypothetical protein
MFTPASVLRYRTAAIAVLAIATGITSAHATNLVVNGSFSLVSVPGLSTQIGTHGQTVTGWTSNNFAFGVNGFNFVFAPGAADTTGATSQSSGTIKLWGPNDGSANGMPATSPDGGNYLGLDGVFRPGSLTQTINGLIVGQKYNLSFYWAGAQQRPFTGVTTEGFQVGLGSSFQTTSIVTDPSHGFTGWQLTTMTFTATNTSEVLSFLALGTPKGVPPFSVLDGVSLDLQTPIPEPASLGLVLTGIVGAGGLIRRRFKSSAA